MKHRKQHTIPACYLRAWCDPDTPEEQEPYVWVISKDGSQSRRKAPDNIFHQKNFYTFNDPAGGRDLSLEHGLSELEGMFAELSRTKLPAHEDLDAKDRLVLCAFMAAMQLRTPSAREHVLAEFEPMLEMMREMAKWAKAATPEEKRAASRSLSNDGKGRGMTLEEVAAIVAEPQILIPERVNILTRLFVQFKLDLAIVETTTPLGFVTSDHPCVWVDPEGHTRSGVFQGPALMYKTIEITLPISPLQVLVLNRQGLTGYRPCDEMKVVDEINRRTITFADESFIAKQPETRSEWFA